MQFCLPRRFSPVSVCVTQILVGRASSYSNFPPTPHPNFSLNRPSLTAVGRFAHKFVGNSAHML
jgi:hypothetical protein